jgi:DNA-directed RNA polymerase specialized sigma24 family protein
LEELLATYWKPVYCYLRCKGHDWEGAKDLTQGFFHEIVLGQGLIQQADRAKGRFRTFLLRCLDHYTANVLRNEGRKKRMPEGGLVRLEGIEGLNLPESAHYCTPSELFDYAWASALLDQVLAEVKAECRRMGKTTHWAVFSERVLRPIMDNAEPPPLGRLCEKYRIRNRTIASNMTITVKRRFQVILRRHVRRFVDSDSEVYEEVRHLMRIFSRGAQDRKGTGVCILEGGDSTAGRSDNCPESHNVETLP